jgi:hypothetical protein
LAAEWIAGRANANSFKEHLGESEVSSDIIGTEPQSESVEVAPRVLAPEGPNWQEQDPLLREMWMHNQPPAAIAKALGRSVPAIMTRAARLGLPRRFAPGRKPGRRPLETEGAPRETPRTKPATRAEAEAVGASSQVMERLCLMCLSKFQSQGRHNRICSSCKNSAEYESGSRLPDADLPIGTI